MLKALRLYKKVKRSSNYYRLTSGFAKLPKSRGRRIWEAVQAGTYTGYAALGGYVGSLVYRAEMNRKRQAGFPILREKFFKGRPYNQGPMTGKRRSRGSNPSGEDVQYVAAVRNTRSKYGKRRRKNLRNAWIQLENSKQTILSRFQTFRTNGFAEAVGPIPCVYGNYNNDDTKYQAMPLYCFRLSSLPYGQQALPSGSTTALLSPLIGYQLCRQSVTTSNAVYYWREIPAPYLQNPGSATQTNTYDIYKTDGVQNDWVSATYPKVHGFRHEWSDIRMTMYPQTGLPTDWQVRLVKWKEELPAYPPSDGFTSAAVRQTVYSAQNAPAGQRAADVTMMWDKYFGAKILHPHNVQDMTKTEYGTLPFVPLRTEKFYVPAREQTTSEAPARILHKHFFRNDRHYNTTSHSNTRENNPATVASFNYIDENIEGENNADYSPFVTPGNEIWLMVESICYKEAAESTPPAGAGLPTFDLMIKNKHSFIEGDRFVQISQPIQPASTAVKEDEEIKEEPDPTVTE